MAFAVGITQRSSTKRPTGLLLLAMGACFLMVMMDNTILNVALRDIQLDLSASTAQLQWAVDSYILVYAAMMFTAGVLADRFGRRRLLAIGLLIFAVASAFSAWAATPEQLIFWRAVMGLGGAVVPPATLAIIKDGITEEDQAKALGIWAALGGLSVAFGPILGGLLLTSFWWGSVFLINLPIAAACLVLLYVVAPESKGPTKRALDIPGLVLAAAATTALVYGVIEAGSSGKWVEVNSGGFIALGLALIPVLVAVERKTKAPALDVALFRRAAFSAGTLAISLAFFALTGGTFLLVFFVQLVLGKTPLELGLLLLPVAAGSVASALGSAALVRFMGFKLTITFGLLALAAALAAFLLMDAHTSIFLLESGLFVAGLGMGSVMGSTTTLVMSAVDAEKAGVGSAVNNTLRQLGAALGVAALGSVLSTAYKSQLGAALAFLPPELQAKGEDSLGATMFVLEQASGSFAGDAEAFQKALIQAQTAFVDAMHTTFVVGIVVLLLGSLIAAIWVPGRLQAGNTKTT
ncbi:MFS transporter [Paenarthrobacter nitroguajacolicus]|uniref:MFS transporter n=1 Tax=Paenarthrobacter nitroguajacolicus TaxID=211146 RepID=UPI00248AC002|nr:MFS transporter [Paenarthrobacter nitroguajacolicus]MDI2036492.1 Antiseptic resistance protein [Paenarthrobacter nitroguajacolicus]